MTGVSSSPNPKCAKPHWVTVRYAWQSLGLANDEIKALPQILVEAPNGIFWGAVQVSCETYHRSDKT